MKSTFKDKVEEVKTVDFTKPQLLEYIGTQDKFIILTNGHNTENSFSGMVIYTNNLYHVGEFRDSWSKNCFKVLKDKSVTLEN